MQYPFSVNSGDSLDQVALGFFANGILIDNPTNRWLYEASSRRFIPPYTGGVTITLIGQQAGTITDRAPPQSSQAPTKAGEYWTATYTDLLLPSSPGVPLTTARQQYYDRNPLPVAVRFGSTAVAPHIQILRDSYIVPANRRAYLESTTLGVIRQTAAATPGLVLAQLVYTTGGVSYTLTDAVLFSNNVGDPGLVPPSMQGYFSSGDQLQLFTQDISAGGTVTYLLAAKLVEFDA